jgi:hypothetical protein
MPLLRKVSHIGGGKVKLHATGGEAASSAGDPRRFAEQGGRKKGIMSDKIVGRLGGSLALPLELVASLL